MSKNTLKRGNNYHVYKDLFDENTVYLQMDKANFECYSDGTITLSMPLELWEVIRTAQGHKFEYLNLSKQELMDLAVAEIEERHKLFDANSELKCLDFMKSLHPDLDSSLDEQIQAVYEKNLLLQKEEKNLVKKIKKINDSSD